MPKPFEAFLATYADDTAILVSHTNPKILHSRFQQSINLIESWFSYWGMSINAQKSVAVLFTKKRKIEVQNISINNNIIEWSNSAKYLGITLDKSLIFKEHIEIKTTQARNAIKNLMCLMGKSSQLDLKNKLLLYTSTIRPAMTYGAPAWALVSKTNLYKLEVIQNKVLRLITNAPWFVRNTQLRKDLKIPSIMEFIKDKVKKHFEIAEGHINPLIRNSVNYNSDDIIKHKRPKMALDN